MKRYLQIRKKFTNKILFEIDIYKRPEKEKFLRELYKELLNEYEGVYIDEEIIYD